MSKKNNVTFINRSNQAFTVQKSNNSEITIPAHQAKNDTVEENEQISLFTLKNKLCKINLKNYKTYSFLLPKFKVSPEYNPTKITIKNFSTKEQLTLLWLNEFEIPYQTVTPGGTIIQSTYSSHEWILKCKNRIFFLVASDIEQQYQITDNMITTGTIQNNLGNNKSNNTSVPKIDQNQRFKNTPKKQEVIKTIQISRKQKEKEGLKLPIIVNMNNKSTELKMMLAELQKNEEFNRMGDGIDLDPNKFQIEENIEIIEDGNTIVKKIYKNKDQNPLVNRNYYYKQINLQSLNQDPDVNIIEEQIGTLKDIESDKNIIEVKRFKIKLNDQLSDSSGKKNEKNFRIKNVQNDRKIDISMNEEKNFKNQKKNQQQQNTRKIEQEVNISVQKPKQKILDNLQQKQKAIENITQIKKNKPEIENTNNYDSLPFIKKFQFINQTYKILEGRYSTQKTNGNPPQNINQKDCFDRIGIASLWYQNFCYVDGRYNCNDFKFEKGSLAGCTAFKIHPPEKKFKEFLASEHCLVYKFPQKTDYKVYKFEDKALECVLEVPANDVKVNDYTLLPSLKISSISKPVIYMIEKKSKRISPYTQLNDKAEGGVIFQDKTIKMELVKFSLGEQPYYPQCFKGTPSSWENLYSPNRDLFYINCGDRQIIVWMSVSESNIYMSQINRKLNSIQHVKLETKKSFVLAAATGDRQFIYYAIAETGQSADKIGTRKMFMFKANASTGKTILSEPMPTQKDVLNIFHFDTCNMVLKDNLIGMTLSRKMTKSNDGLNHQGGIAAVFSAENLKLIQNHGQTSGHSFGSSLIARSDKFCGYDLGDNYPRGINYWIFNKNRMQTKVVYCFKTEHGKTPKSPANVSYPEYKQISKGNEKFYKWSNDNKTYTQLAAPGVIQHDSGMLLFFCGQNAPNSLDSSKTGKYVNCPRNIGFVKVKKNIDQDIILSTGPEEKGGYFSFGGQWLEQKNKGIKWLTKLSVNQNISRLKAIRFKDKVLIIFQLWSDTDYINTQYMIVSADGQVLTKNTVIDFKIRLHKADDIYYNEVTKSVIIYAGQRGKILNRYQIRYMDDSINSATNEEVKIQSRTKNQVNQIEKPKQFIRQQKKPILQEKIQQKTKQIQNKLLQFQKQQEKMIIGKYSIEKKSANDKIPIIDDDDCFYDIGVASLWYQNFCYVDGRYNCNNFKIEKGRLGNYTAFKIHPPEKKFKEFLASEHCIVYKFRQKTDYKVYKFENNTLECVLEIPAIDIITNDYILLPKIKISSISKPVIYLMEKKSKTISLYSQQVNEIQKTNQTIKQEKEITIQENIQQKQLVPIKSLQFQKQQEKMIIGKYSIEKKSANDKIPIIDNDDCFYDIGVASLWYQNSCYVDGRYNCNDFKFEKGSLAGCTAFKIHPPEKKFKEFLASEHCLVYKFPQKTDYKVYKFEDKALECVLEVPANDVKVNDYTLLPSLKISSISKPVIYMIEKKSKRISPYTQLNDKAEGGVIFQDKTIKMELVKFSLGEQPYYPQCFKGTPSSWENLYSPNRDLFYINCGDRQIIVWMSVSESNIYMSQINRKLNSIQHVKLETKKSFVLAAATGDRQFIYYAIAETGQSADKIGTRKMFMFKANASTGKTILSEPMPTQKDVLNIFHFDTCNMVLKDNLIGMTLSRKMTKSNDGLNHQGGIAAVFSAENLKLIQNHGQTSGHSFGSSLIARSDKFCGYDLGDNYPRGINYWIFNKNRMQTKVVYCFKTEHGKTPKSPANVSYPEYKQISKGNEKFYKWSNDNKTYTQLAAPGVIQHDSGMLLFFCGQNAPNSLDSSKTGKYVNCPRNIGFVKVKKNIDQDIILSTGPEEKGGYFSFGGQWLEQKNKGIKWLTKLSVNQNISRLKAIRFKDKVLIIFQLWSDTDYINTQYMIVSADGQVLTKNTVIDFKIRLHKADDIYYNEVTKSVIIYAGQRGKILNRYQIISL